MLLALLILSGCQDPFGTDRHDLDGFRVAGLAAVPAGGPAGTPIIPTVALVVDGHLWSDDAVLLQWHWLTIGDTDAASAITSSDTPVAVGASPTLIMPDAPATLFLLATSPDGSETERVMLDLDTVSATLSPISATVRALDVVTADLGADDYTIEDRTSWYVTESSLIPVGGAARITVSADANTTARFMITDKAGTFLELDDMSADWFTAELTPEEYQLSNPLDSGVYTLFTLAVNGQGGVAFQPFEVIVGDAPRGFFTPKGRFIMTDVAVEPGSQVTGLLVQDDTSPSGVRLTNTAVVDGPVVTTALDCAVVVDGDFDPDWLSFGHCTRQDVTDTMVTITAAN